MELTKQEALSWHRKMWIWIAREIARNKRVMEVVGLKEKFCKNNGVSPSSHCFCCEYVYCKYEYLWCTNCLLIWDGNNHGSCIEGEYSDIKLCSNWKKQAKLAYKIAMLPEREDV